MSRILFFLFLLLTFSFCSIQAADNYNASIAYNKDFSITEVADLKFYHHSRDSKIVLQLSKNIWSDVSEFQKAISFYPDLKAEIVIAPDSNFYQSLIEGYSGLIEFSEAHYATGKKTIYIRNLRDLSNLNRLRTIILHEYIHLFIDNYFTDAPLWFHEGMAVFFSNDLSYDKELLFAKEHLLGSSLTLNEMATNYPAEAVRWSQVYTKSALALQYLKSNYKEGFYQFWDYADQGLDFNQAFIRAFNISPSQFSQLFENYLARKYRIEIILASTSVIWGILPLILLLSWLRKKFLNRKIKKAWETDAEKEAIVNEISVL